MDDISIPVIVNGTKQAEFLCTNKRKMILARFLDDTTLTIPQMWEVQQNLFFQYQEGDKITDEQLEYTTTA